MTIPPTFHPDQPLGRYLVYGGAFFPPHLGHESSLHLAIDLLKDQIDGVWLIPSGHSSFKGPIPLPDKRLSLMKLWAKSLSRDKGVPVAVKTLELEDPAPTQSYDTLQRLKTSHFAEKIWFLLGQDAFESLPRWGQYDKLQSACDWVVVSRGSKALDESLVDSIQATGREVRRCSLHCPHSSTGLREALVALGPSPSNLEVEAYLVAVPSLFHEALRADWPLWYEAALHFEPSPCA